MTLSDLIIYGSVTQVEQALLHTENIDYLDEYGYSPLIQTAIMDDIEKTRLLLDHGAEPNQQDIIGNTALHWAVDNNNLEIVKLLLERKANPNAYTTSGQPVLVKALLDQNEEIKNLLLQQGAQLKFAQDFINTKLLGHRFELIGSTDIVNSKGEFIEVQYEGFYLATTISLISNSLIHFKNNYAARSMRTLFNAIDKIICALRIGTALVKYQHYNINIEQHLNDISQYLRYEPIILPISQEGHALSLVKYGNYLAKCDRAHKEDTEDNVILYRINRPQAWTLELIQLLIYQRNSLDFIHHDLQNVLSLEEITTLDIPAQVIGNCSWANIEAAIPALFFLLNFSDNANENQLLNNRAMALSLYHEWRYFDQERALNWCVQSFYEANVKRRASKAAILSAILFQRCRADSEVGLERARKIIPVLRTEGYEYLLNSYLEIYWNHKHTDAGANLKRLLQLCDDSYYDWV